MEGAGEGLLMERDTEGLLPDTNDDEVVRGRVEEGL
jgi:hypothetical protein